MFFKKEGPEIYPINSIKDQVLPLIQLLLNIQRPLTARTN